MMERITKLSLLLFSSLLCFQALGQYPTTGNKQRLGYQTTGDGLVYRGNGSPAYTPSGINSAWAYIDTTAGTIYTYYAGSWHLVSSGGGGGGVDVFEQDFENHTSDTLTITENSGNLPGNKAYIKVFQNGLKLLENQWSASSPYIVLGENVYFKANYTVRFFVTDFQMFTQDFVNQTSNTLTITENSGVLPTKVNINVYQNGLKLPESFYSISGSDITITTNTHYEGANYSVDFIVY